MAAQKQEGPQAEGEGGKTIQWVRKYEGGGRPRAGKLGFV